MPATFEHSSTETPTWAFKDLLEEGKTLHKFSFTGCEEHHEPDPVKYFLREIKADKGIAGLPSNILSIALLLVMSPADSTTHEDSTEGVRRWCLFRHTPDKP